MMLRRGFLGTFLTGLAGLGGLRLPERRFQPGGAAWREAPQDTDVLVKVIGTAQDGGIPHIGCGCKNCERARRGSPFSRLISSLAVIDLKEKKAFLVDATPDIRAQSDLVQERIGLKGTVTRYVPAGVLLTHAHIGHYTGLMFYGYEALSARNLPVYCSERMRGFLEANGPWSQLFRYENISARVISPDQEFSLTERISVTPYLVPHRDEFSDTLGFLIAGKKKKLLYIPDIKDWDSWERRIEEEVGKVSTALIDGTFYGPEELPGRDLTQIGHPFITTSMKTLLGIVQEKGVRVFFTHLNHSNFALDPEREASLKIEEAGFNLASEGMEFFL